MKVTAFTKYGSLAASTRQRILQYFPYLESQNIEVTYHPLLGQDYVQSLVTDGSFSKAQIARSYLHRMKQLVSTTDANLIWIYAELFPYLPGWFEKLAFRSGVPVVYDCDDAFFHVYDANRRPLVRSLLGRKLEPLLRGAAACCCGNAYLKDYADRFCKKTMILPTVVDTQIYRPAPPRDGKRAVEIGWIGSPSTWAYVRPLLPLLRELVETRNIRVRIVGAGAKAEADAFPGLDLVTWQEETEVREVQAMDIGIMPLPDEPWARGKCGYKLIQYMACGLPVVASPVGVNSEIIEPGIHGYMATSNAEWRAALTTLIDDREKRLNMGVAGRRKVETFYSLASQAPRLAELFHSLQSSRT